MSCEVCEGYDSTKCPCCADPLDHSDDISEIVEMVNGEFEDKQILEWDDEVANFIITEIQSRGLEDYYDSILQEIECEL
jgi:hypothetical protein